MRACLFSFFLLCFWQGAEAQGPKAAFRLLVRDCGEIDHRIVEWLPDSLAAVRRLEQLRNIAFSYGHLTASFDTLLWSADAAEACLELGERFQLAKLSLTGIPPGYLAGSKFRYRPVLGADFNPAQLELLIKHLLRESENEGYPFASLRFDSVSIYENRKLQARLLLDRGPLIYYDSLRLGGSLRLQPRVLERYLQVRRGQLYSETDVRRINRRLAALPYASLTEQPRLYYVNDKASLELLADQRRINNFDGMLGVFPRGGTDESLLITGDLNLALWSTFRRGEYLQFNWRSLQQGTQDLRARLRWPFLFNSPVGVDGDFRLFRRDSTFLEVQSQAGLEYTFSPGNFLKGFVQQRSYTLLGAVNLNVLQARVSAQLYGLEYSIQQLDRAFNPYRGWRAVIGGGAGRRQFQPQTSDGQLLPSTVTDQYQLHTEGEVFVPWLPRFQAYASWQGRSLLSSDVYFNELFRFGGFRTLKGFDEESVFASSYLLLNVEQRYLLDTNSWFYLFWNGGWLRNDAVGQGYRDFPYGFGAGLTFQSGSGIFSVAYALGSERNVPITVRNTKVHLGYRYLL
jgi:hypothetical protein